MEAIHIILLPKLPFQIQSLVLHKFHYLRKAEAKISFLDSGVVRINRSILLDGKSFPGLEIYIRSSNISIIGPAPLTVKS